MARIINIPAQGSESFQDPVQSVGDLSGSGNGLGDIRLVQDTGGLYYWNGSTWAYVIASDSSGSTQYKPESVITLNGTDISNKFITLSEVPLNANKTRLFVESAPTQVYGIDFTVTGSTLSWNGLGLDGVLEIGERIFVTYN